MSTMTISPLQLDYVTKKEFEVFQGDVKNRFDRVDNRFDNIDNKLDRLKIEIGEQTRSDMELWREKIHFDFKLATEIISGNMVALEERINTKLDTKLSQSYFEEYMEKLQDNLVKAKK